MADDEVIAVVGLRTPPPWLLLESSTFAGRYYFFNTLTLESKWSLPHELFASRANRVSMDDAPRDMLTNSLAAAQDAVDRMGARYGASPSRPDEPTTSTAFTKRARDLDPRLMSVDLEEHLMTAINKAASIEKKWAELSIPEEPEGTGSMDDKAKAAPRPSGGYGAPSPESFQVQSTPSLLPWRFVFMKP